MRLYVEREVKKINRNKLGNFLIIAGSLCLLYFLWINYSGVIYRSVYGYIYEKYYANSNKYKNDFPSYDDLPAFLTAGSGLVGKDEDPVLTGMPDSTSFAEPPDGLSNEKAEDGLGEPEIIEDGYSQTVDYDERSYYKDSDMKLIVPRLGVKSEVSDGTSSADLKKGPGLYDISDLPGEGDRNVIIAAHRMGNSAWFYDIDKITSGDKLTILFGGKSYDYEYENTVIIDKADWSVTGKKGYSLLTLTSCHPRGSNEQRIAVTAKLVKITENSQ